MIFLPNLVWEAQHRWPQIEVVRNRQKLKNTPVTVLRFWENRFCFNPLALPLIAAGLAWLLWAKQGKRFRFLGWGFLIVLLAVGMLNGKT